MIFPAKSSYDSICHINFAHFLSILTDHLQMMQNAKRKLGEELEWQRLHFTIKSCFIIKENKHYTQTKYIEDMHMWPVILSGSIDIHQKLM